MKAICILLAVTAAAVVLLFSYAALFLTSWYGAKPCPYPAGSQTALPATPCRTRMKKRTTLPWQLFSQLPIRSVELHTPDGARLAAKVLTPEKPNGRLLIACHGARSCGTGEFALMAPYLYKKGYTVLFPDHRGCGESDGKYMGLRHPRKPGHPALARLCKDPLSGPAGIFAWGIHGRCHSADDERQGGPGASKRHHCRLRLHQRLGGIPLPTAHLVPSAALSHSAHLQSILQTVCRLFLPPSCADCGGSQSPGAGTVYPRQEGRLCAFLYAGSTL